MGHKTNKIVQENQRGRMLWEVGGRFQMEGTYVYLWLIHVDVWQKLIQYCKEIILQLKNIQKTFALPTCLLFPLFLPLSFPLPLSFALSLPLRHCCSPRKLCGPPEVKAVTPPWLPSGAPPLPSRSQSPAGQCTVESLLRPASVGTCFLTGRMTRAWRHLLKALHLKTLSHWTPKTCSSLRGEWKPGGCGSVEEVSERGRAEFWSLLPGILEFQTYHLRPVGLTSPCQTQCPLLMSNIL